METKIMQIDCVHGSHHTGALRHSAQIGLVSRLEIMGKCYGALKCPEIRQKWIPYCDLKKKESLIKIGLITLTGAWKFCMNVLNILDNK